jgi:hypothetical protein
MWAILGEHTRDLLTLDGRPIVHTNRAEMEWLLPGARVVLVTPQDLARRSPLPPLQLKDHPDLAGLSWPLRREEFR